MNPLQQLLNRARAFWAGQSLARRAMFGVLGFSIIAIAAATGIAVQTKHVPLYPEPLSLDEAGAITTKLREQNKTFKLEAGGSIITVPEDELPAIRVLLAADGVPAKGKGFELFDSGQFAVPPDVQRINYLRALQGELARTIQQIDSVQSARVHIARPEWTPFSREQRATTASVVIRLKTGRDLSRSQAAGVVGMVSRAVEGLKPENVTLVDTTGRQLSDPRAGENDSISGAHLDYQKDLEQYLASKAQTLLNAHLGAGRAVITVRADIDFKKVRERSRKYESPGVTSAERTMTSKSTGGTSARGVAGAGSNIRQAGNTSGGGGGTSNDEANSADYLVSTTERDLEDRMASVNRLSIAALVDLAPPEGDNPRPSISLADAQDIIKQAIGYKQGRDDIKVTDARLGVPTSAPEAADGKELLTQTTAIVTLVRNGALALTALIVLAMLSMLVLRRRRPPPELPAAATPTAPSAADQEKAAEEKRRRDLEAFIELARRDPDFVAKLLIQMLEAPEAEETV